MRGNVRGSIAELRFSEAIAYHAFPLIRPGRATDRVRLNLIIKRFPYDAMEAGATYFSPVLARNCRL